MTSKYIILDWILDLKKDIIGIIGNGLHVTCTIVNFLVSMVILWLCMRVFLFLENTY